MGSILAKPQLGPMQVELRDYQDLSIEKIRAVFARRARSALLVLATGLGKTITFGMIARMAIEKGNRVLILVHRLELAEQASQKLDLLGVTAEIEMADRFARARYDDPDCVVASVQSLQRKRLEAWPKDYFQLIITDEAHHAVAESYQAIYRHFDRARHLGVTATADRADKVGLGTVFETIAHEVSLFEGMTAPAPGPYLSRLLFCQRDIAIDLRKLRTKKGDYSDADLEAVIGPMVELLANAFKQEIGERLAIIFMPGVKSAEGLASALQSLGIRAESISGGDPDRSVKVARFRQGDTQILVNVGVLCEGADFPKVSAIGLGRPTKSRGLYMQMIGRGTRLFPGKENCLVIDFDYLTAKHDLVRPADLFGLPPKVAKAVSESMGKDAQLDLLDQVAKARETVERAETLKIKAEERKIQYRYKNTFDPLDYSKIVMGSDYTPPASADAKMASPKQQALLAKMGMNPSGVTKDQANYFIGHQFKRWDAGLSTNRQIVALIRNGFEPAQARSMTKAEAGEHLDRIFGGRAKAHA